MPHSTNKLSTSPTSTTSSFPSLQQDDIQPVQGRAILVAVDGSRNADQALTYALEHIVQKGSDTLYIVHVRPEVQIVLAQEYLRNAGQEVFDALMAQDKQSIEESFKLVESRVKDIHDKGFQVYGESLVGDPRTTIVAYAVNKGINIVVVGSRGLGTLKRLLVGSVSSFIVRHCHCSVVVVREKEIPAEVSNPHSQNYIKPTIVL